MLSSIPEEMGDLDNLEELELSYNSTNGFPMALSRLSKLRRLRLSGNELHRVPDFVHRLSSLEELVLDENNIRTIPDNFSKLAKLQKLNLENNLRLEYIPPFLLYITKYDKLEYEQTTRVLKRQRQKAVYAKQRTMRLITRGKNDTIETKYSPSSVARDPILMEDVDSTEWITQNWRDNFILEYGNEKYALKKTYFKVVVPYFVLESCEKGDSKEYVCIEKYGIPVKAILPLASVKYLSSSVFQLFRLNVSNTEKVRTRPKLLIKNTVLHKVEDLHAEHISVLPERLIPFVRSYSHRWDTYINHYLRSGLSIDKYGLENPRFYVEFAASQKEGKRQLTEFVDALDEVFEKYAEVSDTDIVVYRGTKDSPSMEPYMGFVAGYISTSTNPIVAENFTSREHNCCVYRLIVSAGVPFISVKKYSQHSTEDEILLPRGVFSELVEVIEPLDEMYIKEYVVRIRLVNDLQFSQHRYVCKTYPVAHVRSASRKTRSKRQIEK